jgi:hypothetical protein
MTEGRSEVPLRKSRVERSEAQDLRERANGPKPIRRERAGARSYEDASDLNRQKRRLGR